MTQLSDLQCKATAADAGLLSAEQIAELLPQIPGWTTSNPGQILQLEKTFSFNSFVAAMDFANQLSLIAEANDHHPALLIQYGSVTVNWWSHSIRGLHLNDFILAAKTNKAYSSL
jgi:4a-hydroxytetrahydrobiopterin dehydratase